jgi:hypothetical protein
MLERCKAEPSGELPAGAELVRVGDRGGERRSTDDADPRDRRKPFGDIARAMPSEQLALERR